MQLTSHVERRELARAHIHAFPTEKRQLRAKAGCIWAWLDGIARGRARARRQLESDPQTSTQEAPATAEPRPPAPAAAGSGRGGAMGAWGRGGARGPGSLTRPFLGTPTGVPVPSIPIDTVEQVNLTVYIVRSSLVSSYCIVFDVWH